MATSTQMCGICDLQHISKAAADWCSECDEGFCIDCSKHHSLAKLSRYHTTTPIEDYQKLPPHILEIEQFCKEHDEKFILFCKFHDSPYCRTCSLKKHKQCQDIAKIEDVVQNIKSSNAFLETEQRLTELMENINKIKHDREDNLESLEDSKIKVEKEIKEFRIKINDHLDKLLDDIMKELNEAEKTEKKKILALVGEYKQKGEDIQEKQIQVFNIKQYASDLQAYLAMKQIQDNIGNTEAAVDSIVNSDKLQEKILSLKIHSEMKDIISHIRMFGSIVVESKGCNVVPTKKKNQQAQLLVALRHRTVEDIHLQLQQTLNVNSYNIRGSCVLPGGRLVFTSFDGSKKLSFFNIDGTGNTVQDTTLTIPSWAFDVVYLKHNNCLAVSCGNTSFKCITFINIKSNKVEETIDINSYVYGIAEKNNKLFYCDPKGINLMNLTDKKITQFKNLKSGYHSYIAIYENNLYHTNYGTNTITCYDMKGAVKWEFKDESIIKGPCSISVDNQRNVYVACCDTSNVVIISPDGKKCRELLSTKDKLYQPWALHYNRGTDNLLVANLKDTAFLYKVT